jgi:hypothetical protein
MATDQFNKRWITEHSIQVLQTYDGQITVRQLYYRLVAQGMTNDLNHYKRVVNAMSDARWSGDVEFTAFIDRERSMVGETLAQVTVFDEEVEKAKSQIQAWMEHYRLNRWENQPEYIECWIEKKALQGVFENVCSSYSVGLAPCKGYPSLTFLYEAETRLSRAQSLGQEVTLLYFGDHDPSGVDIPNSLQSNLQRMECDVDVELVALNSTQIKQLNLPSAPVKRTDSRSRGWSGGVVELDAVEPKTLEKMCRDAIKKHFNEKKYAELQEREDEERDQYVADLREFVTSIGK